MSVYDDLTFAPLLITDVFDTMKASSAWFDKVHLKNGDPKVPYLSQTHSSNSVAAIVADQGVAPESGNCITVTLKTQATFYQPVPFYTAQNFLIFRHKLLNACSGLLLTVIMRRAMQKFSWGYGVSMARLAKTRIMVPVMTDDSGDQVVDWRGMTRFGEELMAHAVSHAQRARTSDGSDADADLPDLRFEPMFITDVFNTMKAAGKWFDLTKAQTQGAPAAPYVARSGGGNGIGSFLPHQGFDAPNAGNAITVGVSTSTVFYQPVDFYTSKEIQVLRHRELNALNAPLLVSALRDQMHKFAWGNGASLDRLKATRIMVPVAIDNLGNQVVDWEGMTLYGKILRARAEQRLSTPTTVSG